MTPDGPYKVTNAPALDARPDGSVPNSSSRRETSQKVLCARSRYSFSGHSVVHGRGLTLQRSPSGNLQLRTLERSNTKVGAAILGLLTQSHEEVNVAAIRERLRICHRAPCLSPHVPPRC